MQGLAIQALYWYNSMVIFPCVDEWLANHSFLDRYLIWHQLTSAVRRAHWDLFPSFLCNVTSNMKEEAEAIVMHALCC